MNDVIAFATDAAGLHGRIHSTGDIVFVDAGERRHYAEVVEITGDGGYVIDPVSRAIAECTPNHHCVEHAEQPSVSKPRRGM